MNHRHIRERLALVEAKIPSDDGDADRRKRQADLKLLVNDPEAMDRYEDFIVAVSRVECRHRARGACWPCQRVDPAVQAAWTAYQMRMKILKHGQPNGGQAPGPIGS